MIQERADLQGKRVLFIAYFYPPTDSTGVPGSMRTVKFIRNLENGECHVLTAPPAVSSEDNALRHLPLPINGEHVHRVASWDVFRLLLAIRHRLRKMLGKAGGNAQSGATSKPVFKGSNDNASARSRPQQLKDFIYNLCYFPDQAGPWIIPALLKGRRIVRQHKLDAIFATGSPWSGLIAGYLISKATGKPLIADFRDPWVNNPFHQTKGQLLDRQSAALERKVVRHATAVSLNTEPLLQEFRARYPEMDPHKFFVMPNGFDPADFKAVKAEPRSHDNDTLLLCHAGLLYGVRDPAVLLEAIRSANSQLRASGKRIVFRQIGNVQLDYSVHERYPDLIEQGALLLDNPKPYQQCLAALASADVVVNIQPATQSQIPSKLYDYLAINRPIINITSRDGALGHLVATKGLGDLVSFDDTAALTGLLVDKCMNRHVNDFSGYPQRFEFDVKEISVTLSKRIVNEATTGP